MGTAEKCLASLCKRLRHSIGLFPGIDQSIAALRKVAVADGFHPARFPIEIVQLSASVAFGTRDYSQRNVAAILPREDRTTGE
jgi:hypothetical protein